MILSRAGKLVLGFSAAGVFLVAAFLHFRALADQARVVLYNEGPGPLAAIELFWEGSDARWFAVEPETSRQVKIRCLGKPKRFLLVFNREAGGGGGCLPFELHPGERLVLRLRSDSGVEAMTRSTSWARKFSNWLGGEE